MPTFGVAGGYARQLVKRRVKRLATLLFLLWLPVALWLHLLTSLSWWWSIPMLGLVVWFDRKDTLDLFLPWLKGARGEEAVGRLLEELTSEGYKILHDIDTGHGNLDHVVVGPTGVWAIETKAWTGRVYSAKGGVLMRNGVDETRTLRQARGEAFEVKDRIAHARLTPWVNAVVVLTATTLKQGTLRLRNVTVLEAKDLLALIRSGHRRMSHEDIASAARAVRIGAGVQHFKVTSWDDAPETPGE